LIILPADEDPERTAEATETEEAAEKKSGLFIGILGSCEPDSCSAPESPLLSDG
jgi:hypothetical protein